MKLGMDMDAVVGARFCQEDHARDMSNRRPEFHTPKPRLSLTETPSNQTAPNPFPLPASSHNPANTSTSSPSLPFPTPSNPCSLNPNLLGIGPGEPILDPTLEAARLSSTRRYVELIRNVLRVRGG